MCVQEFHLLVHLCKSNCYVFAAPIRYFFLLHTVNICRQGVGIEQAVSTMIVGKTFVTGVPRFCQLILMLNTYFRLKACNLCRSKTYFRFFDLHKLQAFNLKQVFDLYKLQAFNLKQVFNIKISWQNLGTPVTKVLPTILVETAYSMPTPCLQIFKVQVSLTYILQIFPK